MVLGIFLGNTDAKVRCAFFWSSGNLEWVNNKYGGSGFGVGCGLILGFRVVLFWDVGCTVICYWCLFLSFLTLFYRRLFFCFFFC